MIPPPRARKEDPSGRGSAEASHDARSASQTFMSQVQRAGSFLRTMCDGRRRHLQQESHCAHFCDATSSGTETQPRHRQSPSGTQVTPPHAKHHSSAQSVPSHSNNCPFGGAAPHNEQATPVNPRDRSKIGANLTKTFFSRFSSSVLPSDSTKAWNSCTSLQKLQAPFDDRHHNTSKRSPKAQ